MLSKAIMIAREEEIIIPTIDSSVEEIKDGVALESRWWVIIESS